MKAFWVSPQGKTTDVPITHIQSIIDKPTYFGLTKDEVRSEYEKYGEKVGTEGEARGKIMTALMKRGWIRIRHIPRQDKWTVQTYQFGVKEKNNTWDWLQWALKRNIANRYADVNILIIKSSRVIASSFSEMARGRKIFENLFKRHHKEEIKLMELVKSSELNESGLSRIWKHNELHDCGAMTAWRRARDCGTGDVYKKEENQKRNKSLLAKLMSAGYSVTKLRGKYPEGKEVLMENSFFIVDKDDTEMLFDDLKKFGVMFEQDSILFVPKGAISDKGIKAFLYGTNRCSNNFLSYGQKSLFDKGKFGKSSKIYTSYVNGRPFIFEDIEEEMVAPASGMGVWAMHEVAKKDWTEI